MCRWTVLEVELSKLDKALRDGVTRRPDYMDFLPGIPISAHDILQEISSHRRVPLNIPGGRPDDVYRTKSLSLPELWQFVGTIQSFSEALKVGVGNVEALESPEGAQVCFTEGLCYDN